MRPPTASAEASRPPGGNPNPSERIVPRPARSKNGCLTCRRRKVRCDEHRPRCSHCERLNLQCMWRPAYAPTPWRFVGAEPGRLSTANGPSPSSGQSAQSLTPENRGSVGDIQPWLQSSGGVDQLFDYASFMWNPGVDPLGNSSPERTQTGFGSGSDWGVCFISCAT